MDTEEARALVRKNLDFPGLLDRIADGEDLVAAGVNSGEMIRIALGCEDRLDRELSDAELSAITSVRSVAELIAGGGGQVGVGGNAAGAGVAGQVGVAGHAAGAGHAGVAGQAGHAGVAGGAGVAAGAGQVGVAGHAAGAGQTGHVGVAGNTEGAAPALGAPTPTPTPTPPSAPETEA